MMIHLTRLVFALCVVFVNSAFANNESTEQTLSDLNDRLTESRTVPNFENGQPAGYTQSELKNGDVIQKIDGKSVSDPQQALEVLRQAKSSREIEMVRDGSIQALEQNDRSESGAADSSQVQ